MISKRESPLRSGKKVKYEEDEYHTNEEEDDDDDDDGDEIEEKICNSTKKKKRKPTAKQRSSYIIKERIKAEMKVKIEYEKHRRDLIRMGKYITKDVKLEGTNTCFSTCNLSVTLVPLRDVDSSHSEP